MRSNFGRRVAARARLTDRLAHCALCSASSDGSDRILYASEGLPFYNMLIRAHCISGNRVRAEEMLQHVLDCGLVPDLRTFLPLIGACADAGDVDAIYQLLTTMDRCGIGTNPCAIHGLMKGYAVQRDLAGARNVMAYMRQSNIDITEFTYHILLHACAKSGQLAEAERYVAEMEEVRIPSTVTTYNCLINVCSRCDNPQRAQMWFRYMSDRGIAPNVITYGTLCKAHAACGDVGSVERVMAACEMAGFELSIHFFASLLLACERSRPRDKQHAERCLQSMVARGIPTAPMFKRFARILGRRRAETLQGGSHHGDSDSAEDADDASAELTVVGTLRF